LESKSQSNLDLLAIYFNRKQQLLNPSKTKFISFTTRQSKTSFIPTIKFNEENVYEIDHIKILGLEMDKNFSCNSHSEKIISKISTGIEEFLCCQD
jgi:hypothetical protein